MDEDEDEDDNNDANTNNDYPPWWINRVSDNSLHFTNEKKNVPC